MNRNISYETRKWEAKSRASRQACVIKPIIGSTQILQLQQPLKIFVQDFVTIKTGVMDSKLRSQNFDLAKFEEIIPRNPCFGAFFLGTWPQDSKKKQSRRPSPNLAQNFGQIPSRTLGLTIFSELHLEVVAPRFEEIQGRQTWRQQTLAIRYRRCSPTELDYRGECPIYRPLPVSSLRLSI